MLLDHYRELVERRIEVVILFRIFNNLIFPFEVKETHKSPRAYDYGVKDDLSLAKLFVQPFMAHFTGFDQTMDMSAVLTLTSEADPFVTSGAAVHAKKVRADVRNKWAHCDFSKWTIFKFNAAFQDMKLLVKKMNFSPADEKALCDDLDSWRDKGMKIFIYVNLKVV